MQNTSSYFDSPPPPHQGRTAGSTNKIRSGYLSFVGTSHNPCRMGVEYALQNAPLPRTQEQRFDRLSMDNNKHNTYTAHVSSQL